MDDGGGLIKSDAKIGGFQLFYGMRALTTRYVVNFLMILHTHAFSCDVESKSRPGNKIEIPSSLRNAFFPLTSHKIFTFSHMCNKEDNIVSGTL